MARLAILAGLGALPHMLAKAYPDALFVHFEGLDVEPSENQSFQTSYERFGELFEGLHSANVTEVVFAGGLMNPQLNAANFDAKMMQLAPRFIAAMQEGDDAILRAVIETFEAEGFAVLGAHALIPDLTPDAGLLAGPEPTPEAMADIQRARSVLEALGPHDVGQGAVVRNGQVIGIETAQGTDAMLRFVAQTRRVDVANGVLVKSPKPGQDLRADMPAIGPDTVAGVVAAGLAGIAVDAGHVLMLDRTAIEDAANAAGVFILAQQR